MKALKTPDPETELTVAEAARILNVEATYVRLLRSQRKLRGRLAGRRWFLTRQSVLEYAEHLRNHRQSSGARAEMQQSQSQTQTTTPTANAVSPSEHVALHD